MPDPFEMPIVPAQRIPPWWVYPLMALGLFFVVTTLCWRNWELASRHPHADFVQAVSFGIIVGGGIRGGFFVACRVCRGWAGRIIGTIVFGILGLIVMAAVVFAGCAMTNNIYLDGV